MIDGKTHSQVGAYYIDKEFKGGVKKKLAYLVTDLESHTLSGLRTFLCYLAVTSTLGKIQLRKWSELCHLVFDSVESTDGRIGDGLKGEQR